MNTDAIDTDLETLAGNAVRWARLPLTEKIDYLKAALAGTAAVAGKQVSAACEAKGIPVDSPLVGEEWFAGPVVQARTIRLIIKSLEDVVVHGVPQLKSGAVSTGPDGKVRVDVFPLDGLDKITFGGFTAQVVQQPGVTEANLTEHMAGFYRERDPEGAVALVLGAGNVASIGPLDVVHKLFFEGQVVMLKFNPVNAYLGRHFEEAFARLIEDGFVRTAYGAGDVGAYLCNHAKVQEIHITGSDKTHDAIVFGGGEDGAARKAKGEVLNLRRITSELGNVTPVIVVPGPWTKKELNFQAQNIATMVANNAGFNCNAAKVLITHAGWSQSRELMDALRSTLATAPPRKAYYPGASERYERFCAAAKTAEPLGPPTEGALPWTLLPGLDPTDSEHICFTEESFCGVLSQTALPGQDAATFLKNAVRFCNETLWGTLAATILVHPKTQARIEAELEQAVSDLRYGTVMVNHWAGLSYGLGVTAWGAYPGHTSQDIQSGVGAVHNAFMFDKPEKTIIRGPFYIWPKPPWFVTHKKTHRVAEAMLKMELAPGLGRLPAIMFNALRG